MPDKITKLKTSDSDDMYKVFTRKKKSCDTSIYLKVHNRVYCPHQINFKTRPQVYKPVSIPVSMCIPSRGPQ